MITELLDHLENIARIDRKGCKQDNIPLERRILGGSLAVGTCNSGRCGRYFAEFSTFSAAAHYGLERLP